MVKNGTKKMTIYEQAAIMKRTDSKINILFIIMQMGMGGSERIVHNLVLKLDRNVFNPSVAFFFGDRILKEFQDLNVPLYHVPKVKRIDLSSMKQMGRIIQDNNIHIVNAHHFMSMVYAFYGCKIKERAKLTYTEHSEWEIENIPWKWRIAGCYMLKRADAAIGVSSAVSNHLKNKFKIDGAKIFTIQNGVNIEALANSNEEMTLKQVLGLSNNDKVIGIVANLKKIKNHLFLLKAFNELIKDYQNVKLLIIGQGFSDDPDNSEREIQNYVYEKSLSKNVLFLGYRSDIPKLLRIMDIFCLTSLKEGLPISLIEAMAAGLPVIGADVEGIRDIIIPSRNGYLIKLGDVSGLRNAMHSLLKNDILRRKFAQKSQSIAKEEYSLDVCVRKYENLFMSTMMDT